MVQLVGEVSLFSILFRAYIKKLEVPQVKLRYFSHEFLKAHAWLFYLALLVL